MKRKGLRILFAVACLFQYRPVFAQTEFITKIPHSPGGTVGLTELTDSSFTVLCSGYDYQSPHNGYLDVAKINKEGNSFFYTRLFAPGFDITPLAGIKSFGDSSVFIAATDHVGYYSYNPLLIKIDTGTHFQWSKRFNLDGRASALDVDKNGKLVLVGSTIEKRGFIILSDTSGVVNRSMLFNIDTNWIFINDVHYLDDSGFLICGATDRPNNESFIARFDSLGNLRWSKSFYFPNPSAYLWQVTYIGGLVFANGTFFQNNSAPFHPYLISLDLSDGSLRFSKTYVSYAWQICESFSMASTFDHKIVINTEPEGGPGRSSVWWGLLKTDTNGVLHSVNNFMTDEATFPHYVAETKDHHLICGGNFPNPNGGSAVMKINGDFKKACN